MIKPRQVAWIALVPVTALFCFSNIAIAAFMSNKMQSFPLFFQASFIFFVLAVIAQHILFGTTFYPTPDQLVQRATSRRARVFGAFFNEQIRMDELIRYLKDIKTYLRILAVMSIFSIYLALMSQHLTFSVVLTSILVLLSAYPAFLWFPLLWSLLVFIAALPWSAYQTGWGIIYFGFAGFQWLYLHWNLERTLRIYLLAQGHFKQRFLKGFGVSFVQLALLSTFIFIISPTQTIQEYKDVITEEWPYDEQALSSALNGDGFGDKRAGGSVSGGNGSGGGGSGGSGVGGSGGGGSGGSGSGGGGLGSGGSGGGQGFGSQGLGDWELNGSGPDDLNLANQEAAGQTSGEKYFEGKGGSGSEDLDLNGLGSNPGKGGEEVLEKLGKMGQALGSQGSGGEGLTGQGGSGGSGQGSEITVEGDAASQNPDESEKFDVELEDFQSFIKWLLIFSVITLVGMVLYQWLFKKRIIHLNVREKIKQKKGDKFRKDFEQKVNHMLSTKPRNDRERAAYVIRLYHLFLEHMDDCDVPRPSHLTPDEFAQLICDQLSYPPCEAKLIARIFARTYYGKFAPSSEEVSEYVRAMIKPDLSLHVKRKSAQLHEKRSH